MPITLGLAGCGGSFPAAGPGGGSPTETPPSVVATGATSSGTASSSTPEASPSPSDSPSDPGLGDEASYTPSVDYDYQPLPPIVLRGPQGDIAVRTDGTLAGTDLPEGNTRLTLTGTRITLGLRKTDVVEELPGGAVAARTASGQLLLAATAPTVTVPGKPPVPGWWQVTGHRMVAVSADEKPLPKPTRVVSTVGTVLISSVTTQTWQGQPRWLIAPTDLGRTVPLSILTDEGWAQARTRGDIPDTASLKNQFICHPASGIARTKDSWNIEAARDATNLTATMAAGCNP
ncbi:MULTISPECIES: DUF2599 domain-containing protein [unclassified Luteococcus]|uniref:DUF2599 domain-containing protein n=1 Tax=unclassified Luteococcus TaxID=2639923 RepID=UPI00313C9CC4